MGLFVVLLLAREVQRLYRAFESRVGDLRVNDRGAYPFMPECSLGESEVTGLLIYPNGKGMTHRMDRIPASNLCFNEPVREAELHLSRSNPSSSLGEKEGIGRFGGMVFDVGLEKLFQLPVKKHELLGIVFPFDAQCVLGEVDIFDVKGNERPKPYAGSQEKCEYENVSIGDWSLGFFEGSEQRVNFFVGHDCRWSSAVAGHTNESSRILFQVPTIHQESEKGTKDRLRPIERHHRFGATVGFLGEGFRCQEASDMVRGDAGYKSGSTDPFLEAAKVPQVYGSRDRASSVSLELPVKAIDGGREFHGDCRLDERFGQGISQLHSAKSQSPGIIPAYSRESAKHWPM